MLKGIDPILCGDLLKILDEMGHGDEVNVQDSQVVLHWSNACWMNKSVVFIPDDTIFCN
jgi:L-fucose mutarotase/ribose pyranase (RbsD/FucU family)